MNRSIASQLLRKTLDDNGLRDWHIRIIADITKPFLALTSYKDKCIILNALHVDTHPDKEVRNTIFHEVAHALTPHHNHDSIWAAKARELGCDNTQPCVTYSLDENAIDAIRSGATLKVEFEEQVIRTPKYTVHKLQDKCKVCGKVAKELSREEKVTDKGNLLIIKLECGHFEFRNTSSTSPFEKIVFDVPEDSTCGLVHNWGKEIGFTTTCLDCGAHRLYKFQVEGARAIERANGRFAILDVMGLGKTIQALAYLKFHKEDAWPFLWITKSGIKYQHAKEIARILGWDAFPQVITTGNQGLIPKMNIIASYDIFRRIEDLDKFAKHGIKTIVLDEVQAIKNPDSSRTQCIRAIAKSVTKIIPTSGTFWKNRGSEAFVMCNMLDPIQYHSHKAFKLQKVEFDPATGKELGLKKDFIKEIAHIAIRREDMDVKDEYHAAPVNRTKLIAQLPEHTKKVYEEEANKLEQLVKDAAIDGTENTFEFYQKANASLIVMRQIIGIAKVPVMIEFIKEFLENTDKSLAVFIHHIAVGRMIMDEMSNWCKENNESLPVQITGGLDAVTRFEIQEQFNKGKTRLFIGSGLASGEGLNLQENCSDIIIGERQWNPANEEQIEKRVSRIGQKDDKVNATYVHADGTIDIDLDAIVERKRRGFHKSMNKGEIQQWNETDIMKELIEAVMKGNRKRKGKVA